MSGVKARNGARGPGRNRRAQPPVLLQCRRSRKTGTSSGAEFQSIGSKSESAAFLIKTPNSQTPIPPPARIGKHEGLNMASLESDGTAAPSQQGSTVETAPFSTLRQLFSQQLAQLVATLDEAPPAPASDDPVSARVDRIVEAIFGCTGSRETGAVVGSSDVAPWKLETRRVIIETELDNLVQQAVSHLDLSIPFCRPRADLSLRPPALRQCSRPRQNSRSNSSRDSISS